MTQAAILTALGPTANLEVNSLGVGEAAPGTAGFAYLGLGLYAPYGSSTEYSAIPSNPAVSSGVAFQPNSFGIDVMLYVPIAATTTGTVTITMGPTTGGEHTIVPTSGLVAGSEPTFTIRVPGSWHVIVTVAGVTVAIGTVTIVTA